jgi:hypothetical protein
LLTNTETKMLSGLWGALRQQTHVYCIVVHGNIPYLIPPQCADQEAYLPEDMQESVMPAFLNEETAHWFANHVPEMDERVRPSEISIGTFTVEDLFDSLEELNELSEQEYEAPVRLDLVTRSGSESVLADVIHSQFVPHQ